MATATATEMTMVMAMEMTMAAAVVVVLSRSPPARRSRVVRLAVLGMWATAPEV
jgi:hypothetical protein